MLCGGLLKRILLLIGGIILIVVMTACSGTENKLGDTGQVQRTKYEIDIDAGEVLTFKQKVTFSNRYENELDTLVFNLYANAYGENAENPAYTGKLSGYGGIEIFSLKVDGKTAEAAYSEDMQRLYVSVPALKKGASTVIQMGGIVTFPTGKFRFGVYNGVYNVGNFYPVLAVYENGGFREDSYSRTGDPFYSECSDYSVTLRCDADTVVAMAGDTIAEEVKSGTRRVTATMENARDFAFCMSKNFKMISSDKYGKTVKYYYHKDKQPEKALDTAVNAIKLFGDSFAEYPYATFTVVETPFEQGGMEYPTLVYISDALVDSKDVIIHETAHQWWYGIVGNDPFNNAYIDEGLATFSEAYYYLLNGEEKEFDSRVAHTKRVYKSYAALWQNDPSFSTSLNRATSRYTENEYAMMCYNRSAMMFNAVYELVGRRAFEKSLKAFCQNNYMSTADTASLLDAFSYGCGKDMSGIFLSWIDGTAKDSFYSYANSIAV